MQAATAVSRNGAVSDEPAKELFHQIKASPRDQNWSDNAKSVCSGGIFTQFSDALKMTPTESTRVQG